MIIPFEQLSPDTLQALIEEFITREGTDYGWEEIDLSVKVEQVRRQLARGDIVIVFDSATEGVSVLPKRDAEQFLSNYSGE